MATEPLQLRLYGEKLGDYQLVNQWWMERHERPFQETQLPPIGVIVERAGVALGALWCFECYGIGVCFLEFPITKPKISAGLGLRVMKLAIEACATLAKSHGDFGELRVFAAPAIAKVLLRMGFSKTSDEEYKHFIKAI